MCIAPERNPLALASLVLVLLAGCADASDGDVCAEMAAHLEACVGTIPIEMTETCSEEQAAAILATDCADLISASADKSDEPRGFMATFEHSQTFALPAEALWQHLTVVEDITLWSGVSVTHVEDTPETGSGMVRRVKGYGLTIDEEMLEWAPPYYHSYTILEGLPLINYHWGDVMIVPEGDGRSTLYWYIEISSDVPLVARSVLAFATARLRNGLDRIEGTEFDDP